MQDELGLNMYDYGARGYMPDIGRTTTHDPLAEKFYRLSPQSFLNNNPLRFIDPTGMESDDWIERKGKDGNSTFFYDSTIKTNEQAVAAYGNDVNIVNEGTRTVSTTDGKADGRYSYTYHNDGTVSDKNGQNVDFSNGNLTTPGGTTIVSPENKSGTFSGFSMGGAVGGGISFELGLVSDSSGGKALYFTFGGNSGFGGGYGMKGGVVTPTGDNPFSVNDFGGKGNSFSAGFGTVTYERGGTQGNGFSDYGSYIKGAQERPYIYQAGSQTGHYPGISVPNIQVGGTISETKTWTFKL
ncbi:RHS repeat-associated core domain-containing protein [Flavobacterium sp. WV_118_3]|uniref:RHS repeat-associated core domain-containing protein n=1 Tax=Flavobacterium sp. WV_118_3 TaxID=3151764 RepID=UPI00321957E1